MRILRSAAAAAALSLLAAPLHGQVLIGYIFSELLTTQPSTSASRSG